MRIDNSMTDLNAIVESFALNIDRIADNRLLEIGSMIARQLTEKDPSCEWELKASMKPKSLTVSRARLNEILNRVEKQAAIEYGGPTLQAAEFALTRVREEVQKSL